MEDIAQARAAIQEAEVVHSKAPRHHATEIGYNSWFWERRDSGQPSVRYRGSISMHGVTLALSKLSRPSFTFDILSQHSHSDYQYKDWPDNWSRQSILGTYISNQPSSTHSRPGRRRTSVVAKSIDPAIASCQYMQWAFNKQIITESEHALPPLLWALPMVLIAYRWSTPGSTPGSTPTLFKTVISVFFCGVVEFT